MTAKTNRKRCIIKVPLRLVRLQMVALGVFELYLRTQY